MHSIVSIIAAIGKNRELGKENKLLWDIPEDMAWFREKTKGHPVIMGRKTFLSIGHPLPGRLNIVLTKDPAFHADGITVAQSLDAALQQAKTAEGGEEMFIIGGANLYSQAIPIADKLYITNVEATDPAADAFFPEYTSRFTNTEFTKTIKTASGHTVTFTILTPQPSSTGK